MAYNEWDTIRLKSFIFVCFVFMLILFSCDTPMSGTVVNKDHRDLVVNIVTTTECDEDNNCEVVTKGITNKETWTLIIENCNPGCIDTEVQVSPAQYTKYQIGQHYP